MTSASVVDRPAPAAAERGRAGRRPWRSPADQPRHARPVLLGILAAAAVLFAWNIGDSGYHPFYAVAVRSMTENWKAFFYGSFDPAGTITLDKLPGFLWPQVLSAKLFGMHSWALALPQVIEGLATVLALYRVVRRWAGANAGLVAAAAFTTTPVVAGLFRTSLEDPALVMLLVMAADAAVRAARSGRLRPLLAAAALVGLAFQAKMVEAWVVLPAFAVLYLVSAPVRLRRRCGHVLLAGLITVGVSASWILAATLTPAGDRPYMDGTTNNSAVSMAISYNFLNRLPPLAPLAEKAGSVQVVRGFGAGQGKPGAGRPAGRPANFDGGVLKLLKAQYSPETGWLYPIAAVSVACGLWWRRRAGRTDVLRAGFLMWGTWLGVFFLVFSVGAVIGHSYYLGVLAVPLAALTGGGTAVFWRAFRAGGRRALVLPTAMGATAVWCARLAWYYPGYLPWLGPTVIGLAVGALGLLGLAVRHRDSLRTARAAVCVGLAAMLVAPAAWASSVLHEGTDGNGAAGMATVGPPGQGSGGFPVTMMPRQVQAQYEQALKDGRAAWGGIGNGTDHLTRAQQALVDYVSAHRSGTRYLFAAGGWSAASPYILSTGAEVLPIGGFTGEAPTPTLQQMRDLVSDGRLRFVLLGGVRGVPGFGGGGSPTSTAALIGDWVRSSCTPVPPADYGGSTDPQGGFETPRQLYRCS